MKRSMGPHWHSGSMSCSKCGMDLHAIADVCFSIDFYIDHKAETKILLDSMHQGSVPCPPRGQPEVSKMQSKALPDSVRTSSRGKDA
jgi:hypothetical protein